MCILFVVSFLMFPTVAVDVVHVHSICDQLSYDSHGDISCGSSALGCLKKQKFWVRMFFPFCFVPRVPI
jgi:hypothetical protein